MVKRELTCRETLVQLTRRHKLLGLGPMFLVSSAYLLSHLHNFQVQFRFEEHLIKVFFLMCQLSKWCITSIISHFYVVSKQRRYAEVIFKLCWCSLCSFLTWPFLESAPDSLQSKQRGRVATHERVQWWRKILLNKSHPPTLTQCMFSDCRPEWPG